MKFRIPKMFGRPMKIVKKYKNFVLFIDEKTGIRECYQYYDLTHYVNENGDLIKLDYDGNEILVDERKFVPKQKIKNDLRLTKIIERIMDYENNIKN